MLPGPRRIDLRLRVAAPVLLVLAATAGGVVLTLIEAARDAPLVLAVGLAAAAVAGALAAAAERRRRALREVERLFALSRELVIVAGFDGYWKRVNPSVEAVLGYSEHEARGEAFGGVTHRRRADPACGRLLFTVRDDGVGPTSVAARASSVSPTAWRLSADRSTSRAGPDTGRRSAPSCRSIRRLPQAAG